MFDIHQGKFLMLLFVMYPEFQQVRCSSESFVVRGQHKRPYRQVDMGAVGHDFVIGRAGQQAAIRSRMAGPQGFVLGIEQIAECWIEFVVTRRMWLQNERFKKPGDMGEVPFCRADIRHRLNLLVLDGQASGDLFALAACRDKTADKVVAVTGDIGCWRVRRIGRHGLSC